MAGPILTEEPFGHVGAETRRVWPSVGPSQAMVLARTCVGLVAVLAKTVPAAIHLEVGQC